MCIRDRAEARQAELLKVQTQLKDQTSKQQMTQPQERKLFARVEALQLELRQAREGKAKAEGLATELQAQLEKVVEAAKAEASKPGEQARLEDQSAARTLRVRGLRPCLRRGGGMGVDYARAAAEAWA